MGTIDKVLFEQKVRLSTVQTVLTAVSGAAVFVGGLVTASWVVSLLLIPSCLSLLAFGHLIRKAQVVHRELYVFRDRGVKCRLDSSEKSEHLWPNPSLNAFREMGNILSSMVTRRPYVVERNSQQAYCSFEYRDGNIRLIHNLTDIEMFEHGFRKSFNVGQDSFKTAKENVHEQESEQLRQKYEKLYEKAEGEGYAFDEGMWLEREFGERIDDLQDKYEAL